MDDKDAGTPNNPSTPGKEAKEDTPSSSSSTGGGAQRQPPVRTSYSLFTALFGNGSVADLPVRPAAPTNPSSESPAYKGFVPIKSAENTNEGLVSQPIR